MQPHVKPKSAKSGMGDSIRRTIHRLRAAKDYLAFAMAPQRHFTAEEREKIHRDIANDPEVDRALNAFLVTHPEFRVKDADRSGVHRSSGR